MPEKKYPALRWIASAYTLLAIMAFGIFAALLVPVAGYAAQEGNEVDYQAVAEKLVLQCAGIQKSDLVLITGGVRNVELLENIAVEVRKIGAFPLVTLQSDRMTRRVYTDVPEKYDSQPPGFELQLANLITATIVVDHSEIMGVLKDIPAHRIAARNKAEVELGPLRLKRKVRQVYLGEEDGLYPTHERAKLFAMSQEELSRLFWGGVNVDYSKLQKTGEVLKEVLADGKQVHITNPNGTDLKVRIEGRPIFVSDGIISDRDVQSGGAACQVWLPAGEVYTAPVPGTAEGKVVIDRHLFRGREILGLTLTFKVGKLTSMTAKSGLEPLQALYDASGPGKELFGFIDIGINPNVRLLPDSRLVAFMPAGMVTVGVGGNTWAGGENEAPFALNGFLPGSTFKVDGQVLVEGGALKP